jgi:cobalamin biosynthesis protein CobT
MRRHWLFSESAWAPASIDKWSSDDEDEGEEPVHSDADSPSPSEGSEGSKRSIVIESMNEDTQSEKMSVDNRESSETAVQANSSDAQNEPEVAMTDVDTGSNTSAKEPFPAFTRQFELIAEVEELWRSNGKSDTCDGLSEVDMKRLHRVGAELVRGSNLRNR